MTTIEPQTVFALACVAYAVVFIAIVAAVFARRG
jgi:hypothetical protein